MKLEYYLLEGHTHYTAQELVKHDKERRMKIWGWIWKTALVLAGLFIIYILYITFAMLSVMM